MMKLSNLIFIIPPHDFLFALLWKAIMPPFSHTGKLELEKPTQWKGSNIICMMKREELFPEPLKIFSNIFKVAKTKKPNSW